MKSVARLSATAALLFAPSVATAKSAPAAPSFVAMDELRVPIIDGGRSQGVLHVQLVLQATDAGAAERITKAMPRLRASAVSAMLDFATIYASPRMPINAASLLQSLTKALPGPADGVQRVLLVEVGASPS